MSESLNHADELVSQRRYQTSVQVHAVAYGNVETMRSPRVLYLDFELKPLRDHFDLATYDSGRASQSISLGEFECHWRKERILRAQPRVRFADVAKAERSLRPFLADWEAWAELTGFAPIEFAFRHWAVVDDDPPPGQSANAVATVSDLARPLYRPQIVEREGPPPRPPSTFRSSPIIDELRKRFRLVLDYIGLPTVEGYYLLTAIEQMHGGDRKRAAREMNVEYAVLRRLGELTTKGDLSSGRKVPKGALQADGVPNGRLSFEEQAWIVNAGINLLIRLGQSDPLSEPRLTLANLAIRDHESGETKS